MSSNSIPQTPVIHTTKNCSDSYSNNEPSDRCICVLKCAPSDAHDCIAVVDVKIGAVTVRNITVRSPIFYGTYVNMPRQWVNKRWVDLVEITSPALRQAVVDAVLGAVREMGGVK